jgi:hypothetical protein
VNVSNEQPPERKVIPYKSGNRPSTFRRLNIDFAGTALEEALNEQERQRDQKLSNVAEVNASSIVTTIHQSPPVTTTPQFELLVEPGLAVIGEFAKENEESGQPAETATKTGGELPPVTTTPQRDDQPIENRIAPAKDFNRRANSLDRDAMPSGLFPGSTKKVYDALYIRTRGAIVPTKTVQASRRDLLIWTGIRNLKTIDNHIRYLMATGLIIRHWELGSNEGSSYEIRLPEELTQYHYPPLPTTGGESPLSTTPQKTGSGYTQKLGSGGECQTIDNTDTSVNHKTIKTNTDDDDTHTQGEFLREILEAARDVCGGKLINTEQERKRWKELGRLLAEELRDAAQHTETINSVPAFFTTHLRRRLVRKPASTVETKRARESRTRNYRTPAAEENQGETKGSVDDPHRGTALTGKSKFSLEECQRYAAHLHNTGQGIKNPGGFAMAIHRSGMADPLIEKFLHPARDQTAQDISKCPDCKGSNFYYPKGVDKGVVKCKHARMEVGEPSSNQRLTPEEITEQAGIIAELLRSGYTVEQAEKQLAGGLEREVWEEIINQAEQACTGTSGR